MTTITEQEPMAKATITTPGDRDVRIERIFNAPRDRVWRAMTEPELIAQWWGRGNKLVVERRFAEVVPPERVVQSFEWDGMPGHVALETLTLEDLGGGRTRLVTTSLFLTAEDRDGMLQSGMEGGVNESYAALDRVLAKLG